MFPIAMQKHRRPDDDIVNFRLQFRREWLRNVTSAVQGARNPAPTRQRHNLLQIPGATSYGLARRVHKHCALPTTQPLQTARGRNRTGLAASGSSPDGCEKELAPGGHQEQGESRVTEFRAPDSG
ncbi:MAG: hypothetical protein ACREPK_09255, partial [Rhodanobacteraceae bacterium]